MWRGIIIFAGVCVAVLALNPAAWWLIAAEFGAAPAVRYAADGTQTPTLSGPASPWPDWASVPHAKRVVPRYWEPMQGAGLVEFPSVAYSTREQVADALRDKGFKVQFWRQTLLDPTAPGTPLIACMMRAWLAGAPGRVLHIQFMPASKAPVANSYWYVSVVKQVEVGAPEAC
ncbi:MAG: hypothetical protein KJS95_13705 [Gammaproteobacteria bacterium]|nr:hypothetical protein [Gammaproteobacteria bacterium]